MVWAWFSLRMLQKVWISSMPEIGKRICISQPHEHTLWLHPLYNIPYQIVLPINYCICYDSILLGAGSVAVLPINASGRFSQFPLIAGHSGQISDFDFSPFDDYKLATGSSDGVVKLWDIQESDIQKADSRICIPSCSLTLEVRTIQS